MIKIKDQIHASQLVPKIRRLWDLSAEKILSLNKTHHPEKGSPVFTVQGLYTSRGWTEWTQGFQVGSAILQFDATSDGQFLNLGRSQTLDWMAPHLTHTGVHDHGFNNISTYGNLLRLIREKRIEAESWERRFYELALKCSGAVQARRWTRIQEGGGFIYSFNGPHSLFADTLRSLRSLALAHQLGHVLMEENDTRVSLLRRWAEHARTTAAYNVYYGEKRDAFDVRGRVAHESIFNLNDGRYRCPNSQQGFSPFTTWTRGLAWIMCGYAEELEYADTLEPDEVRDCVDLHEIKAAMLKAARAACDYYIESSPADGIPYWDTGAPGLARLDDPLNQSADPYNPYEPVDSSAASIAAQGLLRLGHYLIQKGESTVGQRYWNAGLTIVDTLLSEPYLSLEPCHQGLILHSVYHRPNGWDYIPPGRQVPCGESSLWGDYHAREVALYLDRVIKDGPYLTFWGCLNDHS